MAKSSVIELDRPVPKAASLRPFKDGDEVKVKVAEHLKPLKARVWYPGHRPGTLTVFVYKWGCPQTFDEDALIHTHR